MASGRRGSSADLREALLSLVRTTLDQVGAVRDVAMKQAQNQRSFLDQALITRKRKDALAALGEELYARMLAGEFAQLADDRFLAELVSEVAELDAAIEEAEQTNDDKPADWNKSRVKHGSRRPGGAKVWRPGGPRTPEPEASEDEPVKPTRRRQRVAPGQRQGGIAFVADEQHEVEDLADYMNADDVPADEQ